MENVYVHVIQTLGQCHIFCKNVAVNETNSFFNLFFKDNSDFHVSGFEISCRLFQCFFMDSDQFQIYVKLLNSIKVSASYWFHWGRWSGVGGGGDMCN